MGTGSTASAVTIGRWRVSYLVPHSHPSPLRLQRRLDAVIDRDLPDALGAALAVLAPASDASVWLIRSLDVDVDVNAAWDTRQITRAFAPEVARAVAGAFADGGESGDVLRFPNRAAYLARFLVDVVAGCAHGRWYYESFAGLAALPTSIALRTALVDDAATGHAALAALAVVDLASVVNALAREDAEVTLAALAVEQAGADATAALDRCWTVLARLPIPLTSGDEARAALHAYVAATRGGADRHAHDGARALARLLRLGAVAPDEAGRVAAALACGARAELAAVAGATDAPVLAPLLHADAILARIRERTSGGAGRAPESQLTPYGGLFLLLAELDALPLPEAVGAWPGLGAMPAAAALRWLVALKCAGRARARGVERDAALRRLFLVDPDVGPDDLVAWLRALPAREGAALWSAVAGRVAGGDAVVAPIDGARARGDARQLASPRALRGPRLLDRALGTMAHLVLAGFARRLPGFASSGHVHLWQNFLGVRAEIEETSERRIVRLARPPLYLILAMTGCLRRTHRPSWSDGPAYELFPAE